MISVLPVSILVASSLSHVATFSVSPAPPANPAWTYDAILEKEIIARPWMRDAKVISPLCPRFKGKHDLEASAVMPFWSRAMASFSEAEAGRDPDGSPSKGAMFFEYDIPGKDALTGLRPIVSEGLFQISYGSSSYYLCGFEWKKDEPAFREDVARFKAARKVNRRKQSWHASHPRTIHDPFLQIGCALNIAAHWLTHGDGLADAFGRYFAVWRRGAPKIKPKLKNVCR